MAGKAGARSTIGRSVSCMEGREWARRYRRGFPASIHRIVPPCGFADEELDWTRNSCTECPVRQQKTLAPMGTHSGEASEARLRMLDILTSYMETEVRSGRRDRSEGWNVPFSFQSSAAAM